MISDEQSLLHDLMWVKLIKESKPHGIIEFVLAGTLLVCEILQARARH